MTRVARVGVYKARAAGGKRVLTLRLRAGGTPPPPPPDPTLAEVSGRVTACKNMGHQKYFLMIKYYEHMAIWNLRPFHCYVCYEMPKG